MKEIENDANQVDALRSLAANPTLIPSVLHSMEKVLQESYSTSDPLAYVPLLTGYLLVTKKCRESLGASLSYHTLNGSEVEVGRERLLESVTKMERQLLKAVGG